MASKTTATAPGSPKQSGGPLSQPRPLKQKPQISPRTEFWLDWILKTLAVAAAIVFGIWAPMSYDATIAGNDDNNVSQESVASRLSVMNEQATSAASLQRSAISEMRSVGSAVWSLRSRMDNVAVMSAWEFCGGESVSTLSACRALSRSVDLEDLVSRVASGFESPTLPASTIGSSTGGNPSSRTSRTVLGSRTSTEGSPTSSSGSAATYAPSPSSTGAPTDAKESQRGTNLGAILGGTFGGILFLGLLSGFAVWSVRRDRILHSEL